MLVKKLHQFGVCLELIVCNCVLIAIVSIWNLFQKFLERILNQEKHLNSSLFKCLEFKDRKSTRLNSSH